MKKDMRLELQMLNSIRPAGRVRLRPVKGCIQPYPAMSPEASFLTAAGR